MVIMVMGVLMARASAHDGARDDVMKFCLAIGFLATARADIKGRPAPEGLLRPLHPFLESANYSAHEFAELLLCKDNNRACTWWAWAAASARITQCLCAPSAQNRATRAI